MQGLLDFARPRQVQRVAGDLRDVVNQALDLVRTHGNQLGVEVHADLPDHAVVVAVDRDQLGNVLVNLLMNSLDAMPQGGRAQVVLTSAADGIELRVRDSGAGLSADILDRLFTPFASTKATGTGLGLSICRRIVEGHGGTIVGGNRDGGGAEFTIRLPVRVQEECCAETAGHR